MLTHETVLEIVAASAAAWPRECMGYLLGRDGSASRSVVEVNACGDEASISIDDEVSDRMKRAVLELWPQGDVVGEWHSHPFRTRCRKALRPYLSAADRANSPEGLLQTVVSVYPAGPGERSVLGLGYRIGTWLLERGKFVKVEGW